MFKFTDWLVVRHGIVGVVNYAGFVGLIGSFVIVQIVRHDDLHLHSA